MLPHSIWRHEDLAYRNVRLADAHLFGAVAHQAGFCDEVVSLAFYEDGEREAFETLFPLCKPLFHRICRCALVWMGDGDESLTHSEATSD